MAIVEVLKQRYAPAVNELEWQYRLQTRIKDGEALEDYAVELHILAEKAFRKLSQDSNKKWLETSSSREYNPPLFS